VGVAAWRFPPTFDVIVRLLVYVAEVEKFTSGSSVPG
jgi:hypothetical protein